MKTFLYRTKEKPIKYYIMHCDKIEEKNIIYYTLKKIEEITCYKYYNLKKNNKKEELTPIRIELNKTFTIKPNFKNILQEN